MTTPRHASTAAPVAIRTAAYGVAIVLTSTAFAGVIADARWLPPSALAIAAVGATGVLGRTRRWRSVLVIIAQCAVLLALEILLFSGKGFWGLVPGSGSLAGLHTVLSHAGEVVRDGVPPVPADSALQCLMSLSLGGIAVVVDIIAVAVGTPAAAGLVLLCVFAVPAALAKNLLPWWSFALGAIGFAILLMSGGAHSTAERILRSRDGRVRGALGRQAAAVTGISMVIALLVGVMAVGVGTEGRFPGSAVGSFGSSTDSIGLQPFTSLRGQLLRDHPVELFTVRGLPQSAYLHVLTLRKFDPQRGWELDGLSAGVDSSGSLEYPPGTTNPSGKRIQVEIDPVGFRDPWLPLFGIPLFVQGLGIGWRYDPAAGVVYSQTKQQTRPYTEQLILPAPDPAKLRDDVGPSQVDPAYLDTTGITAPITRLAQQITAKSATPFDKAVALNEYFLDPANGFSYDLSTAPPESTNALADFLFNGKRGFCEQFASAMAVLLRAVGIPSRVVVGFTSGSVAGNERVITTNDAHAWVEAYFPGNGWTTFDPTPLGDGRSQLPPYLQPRNAAQPPTPLAGGATPTPRSQQPGAALRAANGPGNTAASPASQAAGTNPFWLVFGIALAVALLLLATPAGLREIRRRQRARAVAGGAARAASTAWLRRRQRAPGVAGNATQPASTTWLRRRQRALGSAGNATQPASIAWREVLDEFWDRGTRPAATDTVRTAATALADRHHLDEDGSRALLTLVRAVEREWYAPPAESTDPTVPDSLRQVVQSLKRTAPLRWHHRLLPRSVLRRTR